jgi:hypothetical protein
LPSRNLFLSSSYLYVFFALPGSDPFTPTTVTINRLTAASLCSSHNRGRVQAPCNLKRPLSKAQPVACSRARTIRASCARHNFFSGGFMTMHSHAGVTIRSLAETAITEAALTFALMAGAQAPTPAPQSWTPAQSSKSAPAATPAAHAPAPAPAAATTPAPAPLKFPWRVGPMAVTGFVDGQSTATAALILVLGPHQ